MKAWLSGGLGALVAVAMLVAAPGAIAKPAYVIKPKSLSLSLELHGSHGYQVIVETAGHRQVTLTARKGGVFATYTTVGRVSRHGIDADLGEFGRISVRFKGTRKHFQLFPGLRYPAFLRDDCRGKPSIREVGDFHGRIEFTGQHGFTRIDLTDAHGEVQRTYRRVCRKHPRGWLGARGSSAEDPRMTLLVAHSTTEGRTAFLFAVGSEPSPRSRHPENELAIAIGGLDEQVGAVHVSRSGLAFGDGSSLLFGSAGAKPVRGTVAMPKPFLGTGSYLEAAGTPPTWSGSIGIRLPGAGRVPLAGPEFDAKLCRIKLFSERKGRCEREAEAGLPGSLRDEGSASRAQGSGSHSQALDEAMLSWSR